MTKSFPEGTAVQLNIIRQGGKITDVYTDSPEVMHFLSLLKQTRAYNTWLNYAVDLKVFFTVIRLPLTEIGRKECLNFIIHQDREGRSNSTINRRLAAVSSLFHELHLLDPIRFPSNPVYPFKRAKYERHRNDSLYRKQPDRLPKVVATGHIQQLFRKVRTWRDRTLILLMWVSCLRISEAVSIHFEDIECSHRKIRIRSSKGNHSRIAYMDELTFEALNHYLDHERRDLVPEEDYVFIALKGPNRGKPLTVNSVQKLIAYHVKSGNLVHIYPHLLRHTGITHLVEQGMREPTVRTFVGHHHPASLLPYVHLADTYVAAEFERARHGLNFGQWVTLDPEGGSK